MASRYVGHCPLYEAGLSKADSIASADTFNSFQLTILVNDA
jgi:hypothetical protein